MVCNTMRIFKIIVQNFFHLTILEFLDLFILMPHENRWMNRYNLSSGRVTKQAKLSGHYQGRMPTKTILLYILNKAILNSGEGPGDEVSLWR